MNAADTPLAPRLFERLPEIYRLRDSEQVPPGQLEALVDALDSVFVALRDRVEQQYDDLFIETCAPWVIPYLADLIGVSHLQGDARTLRADVRLAVYHLRRKGTLGAVESQVHALSGWAVHAIELRNRLAWNQHLNHLRPDKGGASPWQTTPDNDPRHPVRGGTAALRAPAWLSFVDGPFDPFARTVDLKPPLARASAREGESPARMAANLPNLGVFLWRLADYQVPAAMPARAGIVPMALGQAVRFVAHPSGDPMRLFNTHRFRADDEPPNLADSDAVPNPMPAARLTTGAPAGNPMAYVQVLTYTGPVAPEPADGAPGLVLHLPADPFDGIAWRFRGANLCSWEVAMVPPLAVHEVAIDPSNGRLVFGVANAAQAAALVTGLRVSATHGFSGPVGAQPVPHPREAGEPAPMLVSSAAGPDALMDALANLATVGRPLVLEITDSATYRLDTAGIPGVGVDGALRYLALSGALTIRARDGHAPTIRLARPLRLRPADVTQPLIDVRLQGLTLTREAGFPAGAALIEQAALNSLAIDGCTLDPGGARVLDGSAAGGRSALWPALALADDYGLTPVEFAAFGQVPAVELKRCIAGALRLGRGYQLNLSDGIVDAGSGVDDPAPALAIGLEAGWGPDLQFSGITVFGRTRVERANGSGGIFVHRLEVHDNQDSHDALAAPGVPGSCIRLSWLSGDGDRLPPHFGCVFGRGGGPGAAEQPAPLRFTAQRFGEPGYAQLAWASDRRLREAGPQEDEMGAFGFLLNAHKWKNVSIRLREYTPVGTRALLIPVT
jgi:hypothetical protein